MAKSLAQFEIDETEEGYLLHVGDGQETQTYEVTHEQMAAIVETFIEMLPEDEDELMEADEEEDDEDDADSGGDAPPRLS